MRGHRPDGATIAPALPRAAWIAIALRTVQHTSVSVLASVLVCTWILGTFSGGIGRVGFIVSIVAPLFLGTPMIFVMSLRHHQLQQAYARLEAAARRDSMTGCLHHGAFVDEVTAILAAGDGGALILIDADHFKAVNDTFGHAVGDTALRLITGAITANAGPNALVGRLGGEEFGLFLPHAELAQARHVAHAARAAVEALVLEANGAICRLTVSLGGAVAGEGMGFDALFRLADVHLYKAKDAGRNNVSLAAPHALPGDSPPERATPRAPAIAPERARRQGVRTFL